MVFNQEEFNQFVIDNGVVGFFEKEITLVSGRKSYWYANWRIPAADVFLTDELSDYVLEFVRSKRLECDCFYGVPEGATKLGVICTFKLAKQSPNYAKGSHSLPMGRAKPKEHGAPADKYFVGAPKGRTIVLEDVTTTGGSLLNTIDSLAEAGTNVIAAIGLTNRMELRDDGLSVEQAVKSKGIPYFAMSEATVLLHKLYQIRHPSDFVAVSVEEEFEKYGIEKLVFR